jgi:hypothetical protein
VVSFNPIHDANTIYSVDFRVDDDTIQELKKYVRGYFFVRQTRIPTILAQGITIGIDKESRTPTIPTAAGFLDEFDVNEWKMTHVTTEDINDVNYISEGFLSRYTFNLKAKSTGFFSKLIKSIGVVVVLAAAAVATIFTCGAGGIVVGGALASLNIGAALGTVGIVAGTTLGVAATVVSA